MEVSGFPLYVFIPLVLAMGLSLWMTHQLSMLSKTLGVDAKDPSDSKRLGAALYGGEMRLHDLGVHRTVWNIRLAFIGQALSVLLFAYLIYRETGAA